MLQCSQNNMIRILIICFWLVTFILQLKSQSASHEEVIIDKIQYFFDGMRTVDTTGISAMFVQDAKLMSVGVDKEGKTQIRESETAGFITALGTPREQVWNEKIHSYEIKIDGPMAIAWTEYTFYLDDTLLHCGVNVFQMVNIDGDWKIASISDTRRKTHCKE